MPKITLKGKLTLFDVTNLVVGAIIGADVYVASSFGAGYMGPLSLLVWVIAGIIAILIALCFAQCAALLPRVGGPYAYAKEAWGPFAGFTVGWSLWLAEWMSLAVFPVAFAQYFMFFFPSLAWTYQALIKGLLVVFLIVTNIVGAKTAGRTNDVLTLVKLSPLILFVGFGLIHIFSNPSVTASNFSPFSPFGFSNFGTTLVLIFWAYAGFELSTIPANNIKDPERTIPRAIVLGILVVIIFYLTTNVVLFGVRPSVQLASDTAPLGTAAASMALLLGAVVGVGALVSVAGSDESGMIGTTSLGYALAADGLFPRAFAKVHPRFKTPYLGIIILATTALFASLVGNLGMLVATSVLFLAVAYAATCASIFWLRRKCQRPRFQLRGGMLIPGLGIIFSIYLITQCRLTQIAIGAALLLAGMLIYAKKSPRKEVAELKQELTSRDSVLRKAYAQEDRFLAHALRHIKRIFRRLTGRKQTWETPG